MGPDMLSPFEKLTDLMTNLEELDLPAIYDILGQLCKTLRISKGETTFAAWTFICWIMSAGTYADGWMRGRNLSVFP